MPERNEKLPQNAFAGRESKPTEKALASVLGDSFALWKQLVVDLRRNLKLDAAEWHTSSVKLGWSLRLQQKKRNIVYLGPRDGFFLAAFVLGEKAISAARKSALPSEVLKIIANAKRYAEGTAVRVEVRQPADIEVVKTLAKIKIEN